MKKVILFLMIGIFMVAQIAAAHPPSRIEAKFFPDTKTLNVYVAHFVFDPANHYVKEVTIDINDRRKIVVEEFNKQDDNTGLSLSLTLPDAKPGDVITVTATCSKIGELSKEFKI